MERHTNPVLFCIIPFLLTLSGTFLSCAGSPPPVVTVVPPDAAEEKPPVQDLRRLPQLSPIDEVVNRVKNNSGDIKKYFLADSDTITVRGGLDGFTVAYDLENLLPLSDTQFEVDFLVEETGSGSSRKDRLLWTIGEDAAVILLSFDDDYLAVWEQHFDL
ncbi:MAG: hypothetical protein LBP32_07575, partial [Spirochaetaceae bacterium]|nr:hypothetical protein [Spirochaetaceae bacterium]